MSHSDYSSIEFPADIDYDQLMEFVKSDPSVIERLVDQYLSVDPVWNEREEQIRKMRELRHKMMADMDGIDADNREFDQMVAQMGGIAIQHEEIVDNNYYDDEYNYYANPVQRVIDINELRSRMNKNCPQVKADTDEKSDCKKVSGESVGTQSDDAFKQEVLTGIANKMVSNPQMEKTSLTPSTSGILKRDNILKPSMDCDVLITGISKRSDVKNVPKTGPLIKEPLKAGDKVYAASYGIVYKPWKLAQILMKPEKNYFILKFNDPVITGGNFMSGKLIAYTTKPTVGLQIGERVIALFDENPSSNMIASNQSLNTRKDFYSGTVAEPPKNTNSYRYLIFFDKNAFRYVDAEDLRVIYEKNKNQWEEVGNDTEYSEFIRSYLESYPERPMLRLQLNDRIRVKYLDKWEFARVIDLDASLLLMAYEKYEVTEWIYRGSRRLQDIYNELNRNKTSTVKHRAGRSTTRICRRLEQSHAFVEWTDDLPEDEDSKHSKSDDEIVILDADQTKKKKKTKQTARKSTAKCSGNSSSSSCDTSNLNESEHLNVIKVEVVRMPHFDRKVKPYVPHTCGVNCFNPSVVESRKFYDENPYHIPLLCGYRREIVRYPDNSGRTSQIIYRAPCGRRLRSIYEAYRYLLETQSLLDIDLFTFSVKNVLIRKSSPIKARFHIPDISEGKEPQPISCVNTVDDDNLGNVKYHNERFPHPDVDFNIDKDFLSCCDCEDNCVDSECCPCQQLTVEAAESIRKFTPQNPGYEYKRLDDFIMTGIFECNEKCSCNSSCPIRVVQNGIKCRLQLFKTLKKGWGVRVLHDVPKGAFLCIYAAQILNEDVADKEGKTFGDEYLADLDYIDVCEHHKEGYESGVDEDDDEYEDSDEDYKEEDNSSDEDYKYFGKKGNRKTHQRISEAPLERSNIVHNVRKRNEDKSVVKYSIREDFYKEDFSYSLDAKKKGNIGRYLNHSCEPNCFVQNVFVDTHDLRFPWVSFFAKKDINAFEELTWDYNYEIGSIPGRKMPCYCGASKCRKRLL